MVDNTNTSTQEHKFYISSKSKPEVRFEVPQALFLAISGNIQTEINYDQETKSYTSLFVSNVGHGISSVAEREKFDNEFAKSPKTKSTTFNKNRYTIHDKKYNYFRVSKNEFEIFIFILQNCIDVGNRPHVLGGKHSLYSREMGDEFYIEFKDILSNDYFHQHFLEYYNEEKFIEFKKSPNDFYRSELSQQNSKSLLLAFQNKKINSKSLFGTIIDFILNLIKSFFSKAASLFKGIFSFFSSSQSMKETPTTLQKPLEKSPITHKPEIQEFTSQQQQPQQPQQPTTSPKLTKNS